MTDVDRGSSQQPRLSQGPSAVRKGARALPTYRNDANFGRASGKVMNLGSIEKDVEGFEPFGPYLQDDIWHSPPPTIQPVKPKPKPKPATQVKKATQPLFIDDDDDDVFNDEPAAAPSQPKVAPKPAPRKPANPPKPPSRAAPIDDYDSIPEPAPRKKTPAVKSSQASSISRNQVSSSQPSTQRQTEKGKSRALPTIQEDEDVPMDDGIQDSNMSLASVVDPPAPYNDDDDSGNEDFGGPGDMDVDDEPTPRPPKRTSPSKTEKGRKAREPSEEPQDLAGDDQPDDGNDYDMQPPQHDDVEEDEPEESPRSKRARLALEKKEAKKAKERERKEKAAAARKERQPLKPKDQNAGSGRKRVIPMDDDDISEDDTGLRRGKRKRFAPLEYWRGERVEVRRPARGEAPVPIIAKIIKIPQDEPQPLGAKHKRRGTTKPPSSRGPSGKPGKPKEKETWIEDPGEDGLDDDTEPTALVLDFETREEVEKVVAKTEAMLQFTKPVNAPYLFEKALTDDDFFASGILLLPMGTSKPSKPSRDNTYMFYVIEGAVRVKVHQKSFVVARRGMFMIPRGNQYYIENIADKDCRLFFAQARKVTRNMVPSPKKQGSRMVSQTPSRSVTGSPSKSTGPFKRPADKAAGRS